jgi:peptidoglycan/xylan/chitin deacetylase (PgdA/CDA1 family)
MARRLFSFPYFIVGIILGLIILFCIFTKFFVNFWQTRSVFVTIGNEQKKIPGSVKVKRVQPGQDASVSASFRIPILIYHYVEFVQDRRDTIRQSLNITPPVFEAQVKTLINDGYTFMTAAELGQVMDNSINLPEKPVILTFDDGHADFATNVLPILKKYKIKATAYIISGFINKLDFMTEKQIQEVISSGLVDIGAHTVHHVSLNEKLTGIVWDEVIRSKISLQNGYQIRVVSFAYPNGSFDQQTIDEVKKAGFTTAVSTIPGIMQTGNNRYFLYRIRPGNLTGEELLQHLQEIR